MKTFQLRDKETEQIHADVVQFDDNKVAVHMREGEVSQSYTLQYDSLDVVDRVYQSTDRVPVD